MHFSIVSAVIINVSRSTSAKTGVAPERTIIFIVETHVNDGVITSSPGPIFKALSAMCIPPVAEERATANLAPVYLDKFFSNSAFQTPVVIQLDSNTLLTASASSFVIDGLQKGKNSCLIKTPVIYIIILTIHFIAGKMPRNC